MAWDFEGEVLREVAVDAFVHALRFPGRPWVFSFRRAPYRPTSYVRLEPERMYELSRAERPIASFHREILAGLKEVE